MENYKSTADLRSSSCLLLRLLNGIKKGVKWVKTRSKFIIWIEGDYLLLLVQLKILTLLKANSIPLKGLLSLRREKNLPGQQFRLVKLGSGSELLFWEHVSLLCWLQMEPVERVASLGKIYFMEIPTSVSYWLPKGPHNTIIQGNYFLTALT